MIKKVKTKDGSVTYYNETMDEHYHSMSGALEEASKKHLVPTELLRRLEENNGHIVIADVCFGLGYNAIVAMAQAEAFTDAHVELYAFENDPEILAKIKTLQLPAEYSLAVNRILTLIDEASIVHKKPTYTVYRTADELFSGSLYLGDMRTTLAVLPLDTVDIVFFDPFSPGKQPELWEEEIFAILFKAMKPGGILTTYSCATRVRERMRNVGFAVKDGVILGRKSPSTLAIKPK